MTSKPAKELAEALHAAGESELEVVDADIHQQAVDTLRLQQDRDAIAQGIAEMELGDRIPLDQAFDDISANLVLRQRQQ